MVLAGWKSAGKLALGAACGLLLAGAAQAEEVRVMISGGFGAAYRELVPGFEKQSGDHVDTAVGPSMGTTVNAIPVRIARGEPVDVVIMVGSAVDGLIRDGKVVPGSKVDLVRSEIGVAVRAGAPKPDISTPEAFKQALLHAKSIAYSDSASGVYVQDELLDKLGIKDQVKDRARMIPAEPVAAVVARGDAELGLQQVSELLPIPGAELVGPIPASLQKVTVFSAAIAAGSKQPKEAEALIRYLASPAAYPAIERSGLQPFAAK